MRTSGGRGAEGWIMVFPVIALVVASTLAAGGVDTMVVIIEGVVRSTVTSVVQFVSDLF